MKKILFDCEKMRYPNTGLYHFCNSLSHALLEQVDASKEEMFLYVPVEQKNLFLKNKIITYNSLHKFYHPGNSKYDVWHCTSQLSRYMPSSNKPNVILTVHDLNFLYEYADKPDVIKKYTSQIQKNIERATTIVTISNYVAQDLKKYLRIKDQKVQTIYNGWNVNEFPGYDNPAYRPSSHFLLALGAVVPKKNFHVLPCLLKNNNYELIIAGEIDDTYKEKILQQAALHNVLNRIKIIGPVSEQDKYWYYINCSAFLFPSLAEGFGAPAVEAMYYGKPTFLSTLTCLPEIGGDVAYYFTDFDPDKMQDQFKKGMEHYLLTNPKNKIKQRTISLFSWKNSALKYLKAYRELY